MVLSQGGNMARKRKPKRRGYVRLSRAKSKAGWSLPQLGALVGLAPRSLRLYLRSRVLPPAGFKGSATRYQRPHLVRLVAARRLIATEKLSLAEIAKRFAKLSPTELEALAVEGLAPGPLATALAIQAAPTAPVKSSVTPAGLDGALVGAGAPKWTRIELALGLELHCRDDASPQTLELLRRVREVVGMAAARAEG
jgi:hypothetical protein